MSLVSRLHGQHGPIENLMETVSRNYLRSEQTYSANDQAVLGKSHVFIHS
jgi:hypothetical protein